MPKKHDFHDLDLTLNLKNLIISILDKDETYLKFWTTFQQNCRHRLFTNRKKLEKKWFLDLVPLTLNLKNLTISILGTDETSEILNDIPAKF